MLIRKEHMNAFERADAPHYETQLFHHLEQAFPKHCQLLNSDGVREVVCYGRRRASAYGLDQQMVVSLFIDLTLLLGRMFDMDPQLPWAAEVLKDSKQTNQLRTGERLHTAAMDFLDQVSGPHNEYIDEAQRRLTKIPLGVSDSMATFEEAVLSKLKYIWPEKYRYIGKSRARRLLDEGVAAARRYQLGGNQGYLLYTGLMYMLGSGFDKDPLFSWVHQVLNDKEEQDQAARTERLYLAAMRYLKQWCT